MKKNEKKKYSLLLIIITFMILVSAYLFNINKKEKYVNCIARMVYVQGAITQHLTLSFMFNRDDLSGVVHIEGVQLQNNVSEGFINRNIHFSYKKNEENFILTSTEVRTIKGESLNQDEIQRTFPAFYSKANGKITYTISWQKNEGYLFLIAGTPRFFCEK